MDMHALMTRKSFKEAVEAAKPGEDITYHIGSLMFDRVRGRRFAAVHNTATAAWEVMEAGIVRLVQRHIYGFRFEYIATKLAAPHKAVVWRGCYHPDWDCEL